VRHRVADATRFIDILSIPDREQPRPNMIFSALRATTALDNNFQISILASHDILALIYLSENAYGFTDFSLKLFTVFGRASFAL
jgi:hypothetical protein